MSSTTTKFHTSCNEFWGSFVKTAKNKKQESKPMDPEIWMRAKYMARPDLLRKDMEINPHFAEIFQDVIAQNPEEFSGQAPIDQANARGQAQEQEQGAMEEQQMMQDQQALSGQPAPQEGDSGGQAPATENTKPKEEKGSSSKGEAVQINIKNEGQKVEKKPAKKPAEKKTVKKASAAVHAAEVAGLGMLAAPSIRSLQGKPMSAQKAHKMEVAGLATLAAPSAMYLVRKAIARGK